MTRITLHADGRAPVTIELDGTSTQPLHLHLSSEFGQAETNNTMPALVAPASAPRRAWKKALPALVAGGLAAIVIIGSRPAVVPGLNAPDAETEAAPQQPALLPPLPGSAMTGASLPGVSSTYIPGARLPGSGNAAGGITGHTPGEQIEAARRAMTRQPVVAYPQSPGGAQTAPTAAVAPVAPAAPVAPTIGTEKSPFGLEN